MNLTTIKIHAVAGMLLFSSAATAQPPRPQGGLQGDRQQSPVERLMQYDENKDGVLTEVELTDRRLQRIMAIVDADSDGKATAAELSSYFEGQAQQVRGPRDGRGIDPTDRPGGPGNLGPQGPRRQGGPEGFRGPPQAFGGPPRPGQILPNFLKQELGLTEAQVAKLDDLQQRVDQELASILTAEQGERLKQIGPPGGAFGPPNGQLDGPRRSRPE
ncbi:MAG: hypothetical protein KDB22_02265 [Planctomycetales bacterium]|nr:hypothetical protein [Planctomycetales bacterium]